MKLPQPLQAGSAFEAGVAIIGLISASAIGHLIAAPLSGLRIVSGGWGTFVYVQAAIQIGIAWSARWAEGGADSNARACALAAFGLSVGSLGMLADLPVRWFTDGSAALAEEASSTLFGRITCEANAAECGAQFGVLSLLTCVVVLSLLGIAAHALRTTQKSEPINALYWALLSLSVVSYALAALMLQDWVGEFEKVSTSQGDPIDPRLLQGLLAGFVLLLCLAQVGLATSTMFRKETRRIGVPRFWAALFWLRQLLTTVVVLSVLAALILVVSVSFWFAGWNVLLSISSVWKYLGFLSTFGWPDLADREPGPGNGAGATIATLDITPIALFVGAVGIAYVTFRSRHIVGPVIWSALNRGREGILKLSQLTKSTVAKHSNVIAVVVTALAALLPWPDKILRTWTPPEWVTVPIPSPAYPQRHEFVPALLDCSGEAVISRGLWSFDSDDYFALDAAGCSIVPSSGATTILVLGSASNDDTSEGGFALSMKRAESLARLARSQYPTAHIVLAALGRERGMHPAGLSRDISMYGRLAMAFTSDAEIPIALKQEALTQTVATLFKTYGLLDRYETCSLSVYSDGSVANSLEYPRNTASCRWTTRN